jgi:hypothetical protein
MTARLDVVDRKINALLKKMGVSDPTRDDENA